MAEFVKTKREANAPKITSIDGKAAAKIIADNAGVHSSKVIFDKDEAARLNLKLNDRVNIIPEDNGKELSSHLNMKLIKDAFSKKLSNNGQACRPQPRGVRVAARWHSCSLSALSFPEVQLCYQPCVYS